MLDELLKSNKSKMTYKHCIILESFSKAIIA